MGESILKRSIKTNSGVSSKRLMGTCCIVFAMLFAIGGMTLGDIGIVDSTVSTIIMEFLTAGVALFGVTAWEKKDKLMEKLTNKRDIEENTYDERGSSDYM